MAGKLSIGETGKSQQALLHFKRNEAGDLNHFKSNVKVFDEYGGLLFDFSDITTTIIFETNKVTVTILWEDAGLEQESFRKQELYGIYYASFAKMRYKNKVLTIYADREIELSFSSTEL